MDIDTIQRQLTLTSIIQADGRIHNRRYTLLMSSPVEAAVTKPFYIRKFLFLCESLESAGEVVTAPADVATHLETVTKDVYSSIFFRKIISSIEDS